MIRQQIFIFNNQIESVYPHPSNFPPVLKNEHLSVYVFFKQGVDIKDINTEIELKAFDSMFNGVLNYKL